KVFPEQLDIRQVAVSLAGDVEGAGLRRNGSDLCVDIVPVGDGDLIGQLPRGRLADVEIFFADFDEMFIVGPAREAAGSAHKGFVAVNLGGRVVDDDQFVCDMAGGLPEVNGVADPGAIG